MFEAILEIAGLVIGISPMTFPNEKAAKHPVTFASVTALLNPTSMFIVTDQPEPEGS